MTTATRSRKVKQLHVKRISERQFHVQCGSGEHVYHSVVQSGSTSKWICDSSCWKFRKSYSCPHVEAVHAKLNPAPRITSLTPDRELWQGDEYSTLEAGDGPVYDGSSCCFIYGAVGNHSPECTCPCHSVVPVPPPVKKLTLEDVFADYA